MKRIAVKNIFLISFIGVCLVILGITSTHALFTVSTEINSPISLSTNFVYSDKISNVEELLLEPLGLKIINKEITINNNSSETLNYSVWYTDGKDIESGLANGSANATSTIAPNSSITISLNFRNRGISNSKIKIGVAFSPDTIVLPNSLIAIPNVLLVDSKLNDYILNLYMNQSKTVFKSNKISYNYATSVNLMNDRLGGKTPGMDDGNIRYYGKDPNNYVNLGDPSNLYRIIGLFKDVELSNGTYDDLIKVIKVRSIGNFSYDSTASNWNSGYGISNWAESNLMHLINSGYSSNYNNNSTWWDRTSGICYNGSNHATTSCDFSKIGPTNAVKNKIENVVWSLGGHNSSNVYPNAMYRFERGGNVQSGFATYWTGKVALMYPSDYGYAVNLNKCSTILSSYNNCTGTNYLYSGVYEFFLTPRSDNSPDEVYVLDSTGIPIYNNGAYHNYASRPTFFLKSSVKVISGSGSLKDPYMIR